MRTLGRNQAEVQNHVQQQPSQRIALNMARYRKAVGSALWVQLALVVCYSPSLSLLTLVDNDKLKHYLEDLFIISAPHF